MSQDRALIVDDSRTAQARLKKLLEHYDLQVDTAFSAEEAFGYLSYRHPAVVFMDHHMEGMDGLNALKVIKSNPDTALIPVIMYTSEQGDVYVGQARALGALDILGKEVMRQASLEKVLSSLGIGPKREQSEASEQATAGEVNAPSSEARPYSSRHHAEPPAKSATEEALDNVQRQISKLFELHITKVRQEIEDSSRFVLRRLSKELQDKSRAKDSAPLELPVEPVVVEKGVGSALVMGLVLLVLAFSGYHLYINNQHQALAREQLTELTERVRDQEALINRLFEQIGNNTEARQSAKAFADKQVLLDAVSWAVNVNNQIGFGETPLNNERVYILGEMLALLNAANFEGTVYMDTHLGNYCVVEGANGNWVLPELDASLDSCTLMSVAVPEVPITDQVSIAFLNYLNSAPILAEGKMEVELSTHNYSAPLLSYPPRTTATTAGEWNDIARKNSRVTVLFSSN